MSFKLNTSKINLLGRNTFYIGCTACLIFYDFVYIPKSCWTWSFIVFADIVILYQSNFLRNSGAFNTELSSFIQAIKILLAILIICAGEHHPTYMALTKTIPKEQHKYIEFSRDKVSKFWTYRFLSDEQKEFYPYENQYRIDQTLSQIKAIKKEIELLGIYKRSIDYLASQNFKESKEDNELLLNDIKKKLEKKKSELKEYEADLAKLRSENENL